MPSCKITNTLNCAGLMLFRPFAELDLDTWRRVQAVNVEAAFQLCAAFVPGMAERGFGRIINVASNTVWKPPGAGFTAYIASTTDPRYTATQFALFTSLASVPRTLASAASGYVVAQIGWFDYFLACTALAYQSTACVLTAALMDRLRSCELLSSEQLGELSGLPEA